MDVQFFTTTYQNLDKFNLNLLEQIYHPDVTFEDPAHCVRGLDSLQRYFRSLFENVSECRFYIHEQFQQQDTAFVTWKMVFSHTKLNQGQSVEVSGVSHLRFAEHRVIYHRDYFDLGEMVYEHVPVAGWMVKKLKQRLSQ